MRGTFSVSNEAAVVGLALCGSCSAQLGSDYFSEHMSFWATQLGLVSNGEPVNHSATDKLYKPSTVEKVPVRKARTGVTS